MGRVWAAVYDISWVPGRPLKADVVTEQFWHFNACATPTSGKKVPSSSSPCMLSQCHFGWRSQQGSLMSITKDEIGQWCTIGSSQSAAVHKSSTSRASWLQGMVKELPRRFQSSVTWLVLSQARSEKQNWKLQAGRWSLVPRDGAFGEQGQYLDLFVAAHLCPAYHKLTLDEASWIFHHLLTSWFLLSYDLGEYTYLAKLCSYEWHEVARFLPNLIAKPVQPSLGLPMRSKSHSSQPEPLPVLLSLPDELIIRILDQIRDQETVLLFSSTCTRLWNTGFHYSVTPIFKQAGNWRGTRIISEGEYNLAPWLPSGSLTADEREDLEAGVTEDELDLEDTHWTLRNITAKAYVRGERLNTVFHPKKRSTGLILPCPGLGEALLSQISWSEIDYTDSGLQDGAWAGHRFEIFRDEEHCATCDEGWIDKTEEVVQRLAKALRLEVDAGGKDTV
nr:hypothetical protein CFP56_28690 [Quercus suber]